MRRWTTSLWVAAILCVLFYGYGCIFYPPSHIIIAYQAQKNVNPIEEAGNVAIKVKVADLRTEAGDKETGKVVGYTSPKRIGPIIAKNDLSELIARAIETELAHRGFKSGENVLIEVDLIKFDHSYGEYRSLQNYLVGGSGHDPFAVLILHVDVKKPDGTLVYSNLVRGKEVVPAKRRRREIKTALESALKDGISRLVNDPKFIKSLIKASVN